MYTEYVNKRWLTHVKCYKSHLTDMQYSCAFTDTHNVFMVLAFLKLCYPGRNGCCLFHSSAEMLKQEKNSLALNICFAMFNLWNKWSCSSSSVLNWSKQISSFSFLLLAWKLFPEYMAWQENQCHCFTLTCIRKNENKMLLTEVQEKQLKGIAVKQVGHSLDECGKTERTRNGNDFSMLATS